MAFNPLTWVYDSVSSMIFGAPRSIADDEKIWERRTEEELRTESARLQAKWMALEDLIEPDLKEADDGFDAFAYFMTLSKSARLLDWTRASAQDVAFGYLHVQWAAKLTFVAPVIEDDAQARDSLAFVKRRLEELTNNNRFAPAVAAATTEFANNRTEWAVTNKMQRAERRRLEEEAAEEELMMKEAEKAEKAVAAKAAKAEKAKVQGKGVQLGPVSGTAASLPLPTMSLEAALPPHQQPASYSSAPKAKKKEEDKKKKKKTTSFSLGTGSASGGGTGLLA